MIGALFTKKGNTFWIITTFVSPIYFLCAVNLVQRPLATELIILQAVFLVVAFYFQVKPLIGWVDNDQINENQVIALEKDRTVMVPQWFWPYKTGYMPTFQRVFLEFLMKNLARGSIKIRVWKQRKRFVKITPAEITNRYADDLAVRLTFDVSLLRK